MSEIPEDIKISADAWAAEYVRWLDAGNAYGKLSEAAVAGLKDQIARALTVERRRWKD